VIVSKSVMAEKLRDIHALPNVYQNSEDNEMASLDGSVLRGGEAVVRQEFSNNGLGQVALQLVCRDEWTAAIRQRRTWDDCLYFD
jgi:hypothetical protein